MKTLSDILRSEPVWVNPAHTIEAAIVLMRGLELGGLPVLDGEDIVGMLQDRHLMGVDKRQRVEDVMDRHVITVPHSATIREAAEILMRERKSRLPVVRADGSLVGIVSESDLLSEMRRPVDPITELHWSDSLREWAIERLQAGHEITLLFVDIDDFGMFNKKHGHIIGDTVLKSVADVLARLTDVSREIVCRYGGDEFCVATLRNAMEAAAMAEMIERNVSSIKVDEIPHLFVGVTVGQRGGKRSREREHTHYAATLNNLINLASRDCILKKASRRSVEAAVLEAGNTQAFLPITQNAIGEAPSDDRATAIIRRSNSAHSQENAPLTSASLRTFLDGLRLSALGVTRTNGAAQVHVELERSKGNSDLPPASFVGDATGQEEGDSLRRIVAQATVSALKQALPPGYDIRLDEVLAAQTADGRRLITVAGVFVTPADARPIAGSVFSGVDPNRAVAAAVLSAANRQLARLPFPAPLPHSST